MASFLSKRLLVGHLFWLLLASPPLSPIAAQGGNPNIARLLQQFRGQLSQAGLLNRFSRQNDDGEKKTVLLKDDEAARLASITESFFRAMAPSQPPLTMQDLMQFKDQTMRAHASAAENPLFPGQRYWDTNFLAVERALMMGRAQMVQVVWRQTLIGFFNDHPATVGVIFGEIDIGSWVKMTLKGLDFKADIDFSSAALSATTNAELRHAFCENFAARTTYTPAEVQIRMDSVLTTHGTAGTDVFIGEWGQAFAEIDMLKRSQWKQIEVVRGAGGQVTDIRFVTKSGEQLFWETAFRTGQEVAYPRIVAEHEPMMSLEMLRHLVHDIEHSTAFSGGDKIIKLLKYVERSYSMNKKATAGSDWDPYTMNDPDFAKLADDIIRIKSNPKLNPQQVQEQVAERLTEFSQGRLAEGNVAGFVAQITRQSKEAISRNAEAGLGNRLRTIAATADESKRQADLDTLWRQMRREIGALNDSGQTPPENVSRLLDLAMQLRDGGASAFYANRVLEFRNLLADVYRLPSTITDILLANDTVSKLNAYCKEKLKWPKDKIDKFVKAARERFPNLSAFYDGFVEFNEQCSETSNGSALLQASQWVDMGFGVYEAYMSAPDQSEALRAATYQLASTAIQSQWPIAGIPITIYTSLTGPNPSVKPLAWAVVFYMFPAAGEIQTLSTNLERFDTMYRDKAFYDALDQMLACTEFDTEGRIVQFQLLGSGGEIREKADVNPPGDRRRIVEIFEKPGSSFATSRNFNYWRLLVPDKQFEPFSYVTRLQRLRQYFSASDEIQFWTLMLENHEKEKLPEDRYSVRRMEMLDQMNEQLRAAIWRAMADALESGNKASTDSRVAAWKKKIAELEDDLGLGDSLLGRSKGLQSKIDREITISTGKATQILQGDNIYIVGQLYEKYIAGYERVRKIRDDIFKIWNVPWQVDGAKAQSTPMKLLLAGDARRAAPALTLDVQKDVDAAEKSLLAHEARGRKITVDLSQALLRDPDPRRDADPMRVLGQLAFEWEHLNDDARGREQEPAFKAVLAEMRKRREAYNDYLKLIGFGARLSVDGPLTAKVDETVSLKAIVEVPDPKAKAQLKFSWSEGKVALGEADSLQYLSKIAGLHRITVVLSREVDGKRVRLAEAAHKLTVGGGEDKVTGVTASLDGIPPEPTQNSPVQIYARKFKSGQQALFTAESDAAAAALQSRWCASWEFTHRAESEAARKAGRPLSEVCPSRPKAWGLETFKILWRSQPALTFVPKETANEGKTSLAAAAAAGTQVSVWGEIQRKTGQGYVPAGETEKRTFSIGKTGFSVKLGAAKTSLKAGETVDVTATVSGQVKRPLKYAWNGEYGKGSSDGSKVTFVSRQGGSHMMGVEVTDAAGSKGAASITLDVQSLKATLEGLRDSVIYGTTLQLNATVAGLDKILRTSAPDKGAAIPNKNLWVLTRIERRDDGVTSDKTDPQVSSGDTLLNASCSDRAGAATVVANWTAPPAKIKPGESLSLPWSCTTTFGPVAGYLRFDYRFKWATSDESEASHRQDGGTYGSKAAKGNFTLTFPEGLPGRTIDVVYVINAAGGEQGERNCKSKTRIFTYDYEGQGAQQPAQNVKVVWQSDPTITFDPPTSMDQKTNALFDRMGAVKVWAELQVPNGPAWETVAETEQQEVQVVAPKFSLSFQPPEGRGRIGQEVKATVQSDPRLPPALLDFVWTSPESANRTEYENNAGIIGFKPKDTKPLDLRATARVPKWLDTIADFGGSFTVMPYTVKAEVVGTGGVTPQVWQEGKGLVNVPRGTYAVDQQVRLRATLEGTPRPTQVLWRWTVNEGTTLIGGETSAEATVSRHDTGAAECTVEARNKDGALLGRGSASFSVTVSAEDLGRARERAREAASATATSTAGAGKTGTGASAPTPPATPASTAADAATRAQSAAAIKKVEDLIRQGRTAEAASALGALERLDPAAAGSLAGKVGLEAKRKGWEDLQRWNFDPALKNLELAAGLLPDDADAGNKLAHARQSLSKWNEINRLAPQFESLLQSRRIFSAYEVLVRIDRLENSMNGAPVGGSALKARLDRLYNAANETFNNLYRSYRAQEKERFEAKDWATLVQATRQVLEYETGPLERDLRAALALYERNLAEQKAAWDHYLAAKAGYERGEYASATRAQAAADALRGNLSRFAAADPRYRQIASLADILENAGYSKGEPLIPRDRPGNKPVPRDKPISQEPSRSIPRTDPASAEHPVSPPPSVPRTVPEPGTPSAAASPAGTATAEPSADFLAGTWDVLTDTTPDGRLNPSQPAQPLNVTPSGGNRFTARGAKAGVNYYVFNGELLAQGGRTVVQVRLFDKNGDILIAYDGILVDPNTIEGRVKITREKIEGDFRWTRTKALPAQTAPATSDSGSRRVPAQPTQTDSGTTGGVAQILGQWQLNSGGQVGRSGEYNAAYQGTLEFSMMGGKPAAVFNLQGAETMKDVTISGSEVSFARPLRGVTQYYSGRLVSAGRIEGAFDHQGIKYRWWAIRP